MVKCAEDECRNRLVQTYYGIYSHALSLMPEAMIFTYDAAVQVGMTPEEFQQRMKSDKSTV